MLFVKSNFNVDESTPVDNNLVLPEFCALPLKLNAPLPVFIRLFNVSVK